MNRLIRIGILWCLAIATGRAQEAAKFKEASQAPTLETEEPSPLPASEVRPLNGQPSPFRPLRSEPPRRVAEPKRIVIQPGVDAQESEVAMQFMADLEKAGIAKIDKTEMTPTSDSPILVQVFMREEESFEKIKQFIVVLRHSGLEHMVLEYGGIHPEGRGEPENGLFFRTILGFSSDELKGLEKAARKAAEDCGLSLHFAGTVVAPSEPAVSGPPDKKPSARDAEGYRPVPAAPQPVTLSVLSDSKTIVLVIDADAQKSEVVKEVIAALEKAGIATGKTAETAPPTNSSISVTLNMRKDESYDKIKQLVEALKRAGVQQMSISAGGAKAEGKEEQNTLILDAQRAYTTDELHMIEHAARDAAKQAGLSLVVDARNPEQGHGAYSRPEEQVPSGDNTSSNLPTGPLASREILVFEDTNKSRPVIVQQLIDALTQGGKVTVESKYRSSPLNAGQLKVNLSFRHDEPLPNILKLIEFLRVQDVHCFYLTVWSNPPGDSDLLVSLGSWTPMNERIRLRAALKEFQESAQIPRKFLVGQLGSDKDAPEIKVFRLKYSNATDTVQLLRNLITTDPFRAISDERVNAVIVTAPTDQLQAVESLLLKLDESVVPSPLPLKSEANQTTERTSIKELPQQLDQLRTDYKAADKQAHDLAESLRQTPDAAKKAELRTVVHRAFTARQSLLRAELQVMQARLAKTHQSLDMRDRMADQIVDRRVEDLLNPELKWDNKVSSETTGETAGSATSTANASPKLETTAPVKELEGDWHWVSGTDSLGKAIEVSPYNVSFKSDICTIAFQGGQFDRRVRVDPDSTRIFGFMDNRAFLADNYRIEGDQLTLYGDGVTMVYQRGHVELSKSIPDATEEQRSRWRSGIVEILTQQSTDTSQKPKRIGHGVIVSPQTLIVGQIRPLEGDCLFFAKFDDGHMAPIRILEQGPQGFLTFEPLQPTEAKVHFRFSNETVKQHDEVHLWGQPAVFSELQPLELFKTTVSTLDHNSFAFGLMVWRLNLNIELDGSLPVLDSNGDLLAITVADTSRQAVPISQLKTMFPKSFGPAAQVSE